MNSQLAYTLARRNPFATVAGSRRGSRRRGVLIVCLLTLHASTAAAQSTDAEAAPAPVAARMFRDVAVSVRRSAPARVISLNRANIAAELSARIVSVDVRVGDYVDQGQVLVTLDCSDYEHALAESNARLEALLSRRTLADQQLARSRKLQQSNAVSEELLNQRQSEFETAVAEIAAQRALIDRARSQAARCRVSAPFSGIISERYAQVGEFTTPGTELVEVVDTRHVELVADIADIDAAVVQQLGSAHFRYGADSYPAKMRALLPVVDAVTRSRQARLVFAEHVPNVGASGRLEWVHAKNAVPAHLVVSRGGEHGVFIVDGDRARFVAANDAMPGRPAVINLPDDVLVITEGRRALNDNDRITLAAQAAADQ